MKSNLQAKTFFLILLQYIKFTPGYCKGCSMDDNTETLLWTNKGMFYESPLKCTELELSEDSPLKKFTDIQEKESEKLLYISVERSKIARVTKNIFIGLEDLKKLTLSNNNITDVQPESFSDMYQIEMISLSHNNLQNIKEDTFHGTSTLKILDLSYNNLTDLNHINWVKNLEELIVRNNKFSKIDPLLFDKMNNLLVLDISYNHITNLNDLLFPKLTKLDISNNKIFNINENTLKQTDLKILNLSGNKLTSLQHFNQFLKLKILNVSYNAIESIFANDFQQLENLQELDLSGNSIKVLPPKLFINCKNLTSIFLRHNKIEKFPNNLFYEKINHVDLSSNKLHELECEQMQGSVNIMFNFMGTVCHFGKNTSKIDYSENEVVHMKKGSFKHLNNLIFLNLSMEFLETIDVDAFENLYKLQYLSISKNFVRKIEIGTFIHLNSLVTLDLSYNSFKSFGIGTFTGLDNLITLNLSHNVIEFIDPEIFYPLKQLEELHLTSNPIISLDHKLLTKHLKYLKYMSINYVKIGCKSLYDSLKDLGMEGIKIGSGDVTNENNVHGIACDPEETDEKKMSKEAEKLIKYQHSIFMSIILLSILFFVLFISNTISWCSKQMNYERDYLRKKGRTCSLTLLTENDED